MVAAFPNALRFLILHILRLMRKKSVIGAAVSGRVITAIIKAEVHLLTVHTDTRVLVQAV